MANKCLYDEVLLLHRYNGSTFSSSNSWFMAIERMMGFGSSSSSRMWIMATNNDNNNNNNNNAALPSNTTTTSSDNGHMRSSKRSVVGVQRGMSAVQKGKSITATATATDMNAAIAIAAMNNKNIQVCWFRVWEMRANSSSSSFQESTANRQLASSSQCCECSHYLWWCEWSAEHWTYLCTKPCTNTNKLTATTIVTTDDPTMTTTNYRIRMRCEVNTNLVTLLTNESADAWCN